MAQPPLLPIAVLGALKLYSLKVASLREESSNAIPSRDVSCLVGLFVAFEALREVVGDAVGVDIAHIVLCKCRASPSLLIAAQPLAGHKAVHALVAVIW